MQFPVWNYILSSDEVFDDDGDLEEDKKDPLDVKNEAEEYKN